ncbi:MAG TPA: MFS transporter [Thermomicrobiaceae bacterium]|nr:MFS transporter [Thermomicrobiaceae bacterium]
MLDAEPAAPPASGAGHVWRFYAFQLTAEARFDSAIWIIYLQSRGYSLAEIGLAESAFHLAHVLLELPSGSFADLVGRRWSLAAGAALVSVSSALLWAAPSLPLVVLSLFLSGASFSFRSGADRAWLYEAVGADTDTTDGHARFAGVLGKVLGAAYVVGAAATWLGAALSQASYGFPFGLGIGIGLGGVWLAAGLVEGKRERSSATAVGEVRRHVGEAWRALAERRALSAMLVLSGLFWTACTVAHLYIQAAFAARGMSNSGIGLVAAATLLVSAAGAGLAGRIAVLGRFRLWFAILAGIAGAGVAATAWPGLALAITAYLGAQVAYGLIEPLLGAWLSRGMPAAQRATLLSVESWLFSLTMIFAFPLAGLYAERAGWGALYIACGVATVVLGLVALGLPRLGRGDV